MKVKIFKKSGHSFFSRKPSSRVLLENEVNEWLEQNNDVDIKYVKQSCCGGSLEPSITVISVWYDEK